MLERVSRMRPEGYRRVGERRGDLAVELGIVDLAVRGIVERIVVRSETFAVGERLLLVHLGPKNRICACAFGLNGGDEFLHRAFQLRGVDDKRQQPEAVLALFRVHRHVLDERMSLKSLDKRLAELFALRKVPLVEALEFAETDRALDFRHAEVVADAAVDVKLLAFHLEKVELGADVVAVIAHRADLPREIVVVAADHAAFAAGREMLGLAEREAGNRSEGAGLLPLVFAAEALGAVFDDRKLVLLGDLENRIHIRDDAVEVDDDDRLGAFGDGRFDLLRIDEVVGADVDEHRKRARLQRAEGRGDERIGSADHFVAGADAERGERDMERGRSVGYADRVPDPEPLRPFGLEFHSDRAGPVVDLSGMKDVKHPLVRFLVELRPGGKPFVPHHLAAVDRELAGRVFNRRALLGLCACALAFSRHFFTPVFVDVNHVVPRSRIELTVPPLSRAS